MRTLHWFFKLMNLQKLSIISGILSFLIFSPLEIRADLANTSWPMFHHDNQHTGRSPYEGARLPYTRWRFKTGGPITSSPAVDNDGTIYVGSHDRHFYAFSHFGRLKWRRKTGDIIHMSSAAISQDGIIYVGSVDGRLWAFDRRGNVVWTYQAGGGIISSPAIGDDGTIYFGSSDSNVYALNPDGSLKWRYDGATLGVDSSPAIGYDGRIYVGEWEFYMYGLNKETGEWEWEWPIKSWFFEEDESTQEENWCFYGGILASPVIATDGSIYIANDQFNRNNPTCTTPRADYYFFRVRPCGVDCATGFSLNLGDEDVYSTAALRDDNSTFIGYGKNIYHILPDANTSWSFETGGKVDSSPAIDVRSNVYVGSKDGYVYALTGTGRLLWKFETFGPVTSSPAIGPGGTIYIGSEDGRLYAIGGSICPLSLFFQGEEASLGVFRKFRDRVLTKSAKGQFFIKAYYNFSGEIISLFNENPKLQHMALNLAEYFLSNLSSLSEGKRLYIPNDKMLCIEKFLSAMQKKAGPSLSLMIGLVKKEMKHHHWLNSLGIYWDS